MYLHERLFTNALNDWENQREHLGFDQYSDAPNDISGNDFMLISSSYVTGRDHRDFFNMWGIDYSSEAANQVLSYDSEEAVLRFVPNDNVNISPTGNPIPIDGESVWVE